MAKEKPWEEPDIEPELKPITFRDQVIAAAHSTGAPIEEVARAGNVTVEEAKKIIRKPVVRALLASYLDEAGATLEKSAKVVARAMDAKEKKFFAFEGRVVDEREVEDHATQLKAAELNLRARGELKEGVNVNFNQYLELTDEQVALIAAGKATPGDFTNQGAR